MANRCRLPFFLILAALSGPIAAPVSSAGEPRYADGRPEAVWRVDAKDDGRVITHGAGPDACDLYGAREAIIYEHEGLYYLHYDGAGPQGWLACLAVSADLDAWDLRGPVLDLGVEGNSDSAAAASPWVYHDGDTWHMFYLGTPNASPPPERVPAFPYLTLKANAPSPEGPWQKRYDVVPFSTEPDTYYSATASPGHVIKHGGEYLMYFSGSTPYPGVKRTVGIARTTDLDGPWVLDEQPIVPLEEQIENSSVYHQESTGEWFLFTNHIAMNSLRQEYTDAIWVYWTKDPNRWDAKNKAVVLDGSNCTWSRECIGMPSVVRVGDRLAVFYDAPGGDHLHHTRRDIGRAWLDLPIKTPAGNDES